MEAEAAYKVVAKEKLANCHFPHADVLSSEDARKERRQMVEKAMLLGNGEHGKVRVYFECNLGRSVVETTIWEADDEEVSLKAGIFIPIHAIYRVEF